MMSAPAPLSLDGLNPQQREAAAYRGGPLLVLAGAGTGKTRVICYRVAGLLQEGVPAGRMLAVTFTNKAAEEMRTRVDALAPGYGRAVWIHTFHAFAARLLRQHAALLDLTPHFTVYDSDDQKKLIVESLKELQMEDQKSKAGLYVAVISRAKDDLLDAKSYAIHAMAGNDPFRQQVAKVYERYQEKLTKAGGLDFGDLLLKSCELLKEFAQVREYYQELFLQILVDEYQDTNHAQYILTKALSAKHRNLCVVGDPDQSIYAWRGADIRNIMEFERDFNDAKVVALEQNYRSTPRILNAASAVIAHNKYRKPKNLWTEKPDGDAVQVIELENEGAEARWVAGQVQRLLSHGHSLRDMAVFYRTNAQSRSFEEALRHAGVPFRILGSVRFYERKEIKDALAYARVILNPSDVVSLSRIVNVPNRGIGKTSLEAIQAFGRDNGLTLYEALAAEARIPGLTPGCRRASRELIHLFETLRDGAGKWTPAHAMAQILERSGYMRSLEEEVETDPEAAGRMDNLQELINALKEFEERAKAEGREASLAEFLESAALQSDADTYDPDQPALVLMTVHLAKGLEFPVVMLTGLEEGLFPIGAGNASAEDLEEERRLAYVGMTRAKDLLILTYAATRRIFGQSYSNLPSRFILEARLTPETRPHVHSRQGETSGAPDASVPPPPGPRHGSKGIKSGSRVRHPDFGKGTVLDASGSGETAKVTVRFDNGMIRKLLVRYAPLEVIG